MATTHADPVGGFHLAAGGPFDALVRAARFGGRSSVLAAIAIGWLPVVVLGLVHQAVTGRSDSMLGEISFHARLLVAVPVFLLGAPLVDRACHSAISQLFVEGYVPADAQNRARGLLGRVLHWCELRWPEAVLLALAFVLSAAGWLYRLRLPGTAHVEARLGLAGAWYTLVSLPLFQFLLWRSLYRWALWIYALFALSRLPLSLRPTHGDCRGGIGFLRIPSVVFGATLLLAVGSVLCGAWVNQLSETSTTLASLKLPFCTLVAVGVVIAFAPLLLFVPHVLAARRRGRVEMGGLVSEYAARFEERWLPSTTHPRRLDESLLGTADAQSLADLSSAYRENVEGMKLLLFGPRDLMAPLAAALIPVLVLLMWVLPIRTVLSELFHLVAGGRGD